jgi:hypothetical protein
MPMVGWHLSAAAANCNALITPMSGPRPAPSYIQTGSADVVQVPRTVPINSTPTLTGRRRGSGRFEESHATTSRRRREDFGHGTLCEVSPTAGDRHQSGSLWPSLRQSILVVYRRLGFAL